MSKKLISFIIAIIFIVGALGFLGCQCEHEYSWVNYGASHKWQCTKCAKIEKEEAHSVINLQQKPATLSTNGNEAGKICEVCNYITEGGAVIPATTPFAAKTYKNLNYCQYIPKITNNKKVPLVLFLHGAGERGSDNYRQLLNGIRKVVYFNSGWKMMDAVVLAPQCPADTYWTGVDHSKVNYKISETPETDILKSVVDLVEHFCEYDFIDTSRVYVIGLSMGGFATWDLLARHSNLFAAGVPICGGGPTDAIETLKNIPIFTFHGVLDAMVPYEGTQTMVQLIKDAGGNKINFKSFENDDHLIWDEALTFVGDKNLPALEDWLFAQKK